ncbi:MAG: lipid A biosynthesis acyltransferase [Myxococcaceae bacterium]|nr:lipid A biosynthesis acyltransferase [Myxococcaceae bacterium]MCI0671190.1 lipid A biosynthesis acyltransferase [Myxococcaceae bacterium]
MLAPLQLLPLAWAQALGEGLGLLGYRMARGERRKALASLSVAFPSLPDGEREALARASFRHLGRMALELACVKRVDARQEALVALPAEDRAVLEAAFARGRGVVFVTGHVGSWELLGRCLARAGFPIRAIGKETSDPRLTRLLERFRAEGGVRTIWRGQPGAAVAILRALRSNELLGLLIDQDTRVQSVFVPFFGRPAATPRAAADLALRTGAAVVVGFCTRQVDGTYRVSVREVARPEGLEAEDAAVALTASLTQHIEDAIRRDPVQWVWMHQRWKTRP